MMRAKEILIDPVVRACNLLTFVCFMATIAAGSLASVEAAAATWEPGKNVTIIPPAGAGGGNDRIARIIQKLLKDGRLLDSNVVIVNKPGAGGEVAWSYLNQFAGDGNYLSLAPNNLLTNHILRGKAITHTDVTPLAVLFAEYNVLLVKQDSPLKSGNDLAALLRNNPGAISVGLALGPGSPSHIAFALVTKAAGGDVRKAKLVSLKSAQEGVTALMGGHIDLFATNASNAVPFLLSGDLRALGTTSPKRLTGPYATVPTWKEQGFNAVLTGWRAIIGPRGMSEDQIAYWDSTISKLVKMRKWAEVLEKELREDIYMDSKRSAAFMKQDYQDLRAILTELGVVTNQ